MATTSSWITSFISIVLAGVGCDLGLQRVGLARTGGGERDRRPVAAAEDRLSHREDGNLSEREVRRLLSERWSAHSHVHVLYDKGSHSRLRTPPPSLEIMDFFNNKLEVLDFDVKSLIRPLEITWCGNDAICMQWRNTGIVMVT
jgi:hypothetical protein